MQEKLPRFQYIWVLFDQKYDADETLKFIQAYNWRDIPNSTHQRENKLTKRG